MLRKFAIAFSTLMLGMFALGISAAQARTIKIEGLDSLQFSQTHIEAKAGEKITVTLVNNTKMPAAAMSHNFVLLHHDVDPAAFANKAMGSADNGYIPKDMTDKVLADTGLVAGGESKSVTFTVPSEPGDYTYICSFPGHFAAGMKGTLTVTE